MGYGSTNNLILEIIYLGVKNREKNSRLNFGYVKTWTKAINL